MTYMINARLEQGAPSLTLTDAVSGEERLHWRGDSKHYGEYDWQSLFKRLMLLSCADRINLVERSKLPTFGEERLIFTTCTEPDVLKKQGKNEH